MHLTFSHMYSSACNRMPSYPKSDERNFFECILSINVVNIIAEYCFSGVLKTRIEISRYKRKNHKYSGTRIFTKGDSSLAICRQLNSPLVIRRENNSPLVKFLPNQPVHKVQLGNKPVSFSVQFIKCEILDW